MLVLSGGPNTSHYQSSLGQSLVIVWSCHEQSDQGEGQLFLYEQHQGRTETEKTKRGGVGQVRVEGHQSNGPLITRESYLYYSVTFNTVKLRCMILWSNCSILNM